ncbi:hypothetical protein I4641_02750 [Waterburya agarophytonicola K14]|uniref:Uncharacterized protein n=2 Tax=Waterburya TaxID=2886915 RepID=A0A964BMS5_9CYAN|nr:hypothetical protein [Waterburya agarophytonicola KI4]
MNIKPIVYGIVGLVSGALLIVLLGFLGMRNMMWGTGGMMNDEMHNTSENYNRFEYTERN